jgi:predicted permease
VALAERVVDRLQAVPGVRSVSVASVVPLGGDSLVRSFHPAGRTDLPGTRAARYSVGPRYFETLGIALLRGREFEDGDEAGATPVVIVNETYARTHLPGLEPIGQRVQTEDLPEALVVGMVQNHRIDTIGEAPKSALFFPFAQRPGRMVFHVRTLDAPEPVVPVLEQTLEDLQDTAAVSVETLRSATDLEFSMRRVGTVMMGAVGGLGLVLALIGLYGVMSYVVASRTAEVGIRMALGASVGRLISEVLGQALRILAVGVVLGAAAALLLTPGLATFLAGLSPIDPVSFLGTAALLILVGLVASYLPARRAARVDPTTALRNV